MRILGNYDGEEGRVALRPKRLIFSGNMGGASERDRTSDLLITNQLI